MSDKLELRGADVLRWCLDHPSRKVRAIGSASMTMEWDSKLCGFVNENGLISHFPDETIWTPVEPPEPETGDALPHPRQGEAMMTADQDAAIANT